MSVIQIYVILIQNKENINLSKKVKCYEASCSGERPVTSGSIMACTKSLLLTINESIVVGDGDPTRCDTAMRVMNALDCENWHM